MRPIAGCLAAAAALLVPHAATAGGISFSAEVHCSGAYDLGEKVPYKVELVNETSIPVDLDLTLELESSWYGTKTLKTVSVTLLGDETLELKRKLRLDGFFIPPIDWLTLRLTVNSIGGEIDDTCSFEQYWSYVP